MASRILREISLIRLACSSCRILSLGSVDMLQRTKMSVGGVRRVNWRASTEVNDHCGIAFIPFRK